MALPTMNGFWSSRKNVYEQAIVHHRNREDDFRSQWKNTSNYFKTSNVRAAKQQAWSSTEAFQNKCIDAYQSSVENDVKAASLKRRRDKLASLIQRETQAYQAELRGLSSSNFDRLEQMKERANGLKSAREEKRQKLAQEKLYEHWRENNPDLRTVESKLLQEHVVEEWGDQKVEKQQRLELAKKENLELEKEMEKERLFALEFERQREQEKLDEEKTMAQVLKEQMMEFKAREAEAAEWKRLQEDLLVQRWELEKIEEAQKQREMEHRKKNLGRALLRQHKAQMMRKSRLVQEELNQDRKLLESLIEKENQNNEIQTARREKARADAKWMKEVIDEQLRLEKAREAELDMLYQDEAARMWQKREGEWERERQARQRLMAEVLESRQEQIGWRLEELKEQQEESLQRREQLVKEMEIARMLDEQEEEDRRMGQATTRLELREQINTKKEQEALQQKEKKTEFRDQLVEEQEYEDLLKQETERMRIQGFTPRDHSRRQAWM